MIGDHITIARSFRIRNKFTAEQTKLAVVGELSHHIGRHAFDVKGYGQWGIQPQDEEHVRFMLLELRKVCRYHAHYPDDPMWEIDFHISFNKLGSILVPTRASSAG